MPTASHRSLVAALAIFILTLVLAGPAVAACQKTSLADIDDEVMCPICGTPLGAAGGPQAEDEREFIRERVEQCQSKEEIKAALVAEYGDEVLALPKSKGFNTTIYIVPVVVLVAVAVLLLLSARRWRRETAPLAAEQVSPADDSSDASALRADMDKYDL